MQENKRLIKLSFDIFGIITTNLELVRNHNLFYKGKWLRLKWEVIDNMRKYLFEILKIKKKVNYFEKVCLFYFIFAIQIC